MVSQGGGNFLGFFLKGFLFVCFLLLFKRLPYMQTLPSGKGRPCISNQNIQVGLTVYEIILKGCNASSQLVSCEFALTELLS